MKANRRVVGVVTRLNRSTRVRKWIVRHQPFSFRRLQELIIAAHEVERQASRSQ